MLQVILRTCDIASLQSNRIYSKKDTIQACVNSLVTTLNNYGNYHLHIIDDNSSNITVDFLNQLVGNITFDLIKDKPIEFNDNPKLSSRYTVKLAYDYINKLSNNDLVLIIEDDYLWYDNSIEMMMLSYQKFNGWFSKYYIGIFPQDFNQLYYDCDNNPFNDTYIKPCHIIPGIDRYYRSTWFTQESFLFPVSGIKKYINEFNELMTIGVVEGAWEGNTISKVWMSPDVIMLMPIGTLAVHMGAERDISYFCKDWQDLFNRNLNG